MKRIPLAFTLNGEETELLVRSDQMLIDVLRGDLALTGTKRGCNEGACGSCNVFLDGRSVRACLTLAANIEGSEVVTIEAAPANEALLETLRRAFLDAGAIQCGFCMPGMIISATEVLRRHPHPSRDDIRHGLSGNLCRCSGYVKVIEAVELAAQRLSDASHREVQE